MGNTSQTVKQMDTTRQKLNTSLPDKLFIVNSRAGSEDTLGTFNSRNMSVNQQ